MSTLCTNYSLPYVESWREKRREYAYSSWHVNSVCRFHDQNKMTYIIAHLSIDIVKLRFNINPTTIKSNDDIGNNQSICIPNRICKMNASKCKMCTNQSNRIASHHSVCSVHSLTRSFVRSSVDRSLH